MRGKVQRAVALAVLKVDVSTCLHRFAQQSHLKPLSVLPLALHLKMPQKNWDAMCMLENYVAACTCSMYIYIYKTNTHDITEPRTMRITAVSPLSSTNFMSAPASIAASAVLTSLWASAESRDRPNFLGLSLLSINSWMWPVRGLWKLEPDGQMNSPVSKTDNVQICGTLRSLFFFAGSSGRGCPAIFSLQFFKGLCSSSGFSTTWASNSEIWITRPHGFRPKRKATQDSEGKNREKHQFMDQNGAQIITNPHAKLCPSDIMCSGMTLIMSDAARPKESVAAASAPASNSTCAASWSPWRRDDEAVKKKYLQNLTNHTSIVPVASCTVGPRSWILFHLTISSCSVCRTMDWFKMVKVKMLLLAARNGKDSCHWLLIMQALSILTAICSSSSGWYFLTHPPNEQANSWKHISSRFHMISWWHGSLLNCIIRKVPVNPKQYKIQYMPNRKIQKVDQVQLAQFFLAASSLQLNRLKRLKRLNRPPALLPSSTVSGQRNPSRLGRP